MEKDWIAIKDLDNPPEELKGKLDLSFGSEDRFFYGLCKMVRKRKVQSRERFNE